MGEEGGDEAIQSKAQEVNQTLREEKEGNTYVIRPNFQHKWVFLIAICTHI